MPLSTIQLENLLALLNSYASTPTEFMISLLQSAEYMDHDAVHEVQDNVERILESLSENPGCSERTIHWAHGVTRKAYATQIQALVQKSMGLQFSAKRATAQKLKDFDILATAEHMKALAPNLWELFSTLLQADTSSNTAREVKRGKREEKRAQRNGDRVDFAADDEDSEAEYWRGQEDVYEGNAGDECDADEATARREALMTTVR
jgi:hypothetical protein